MTATGVTELIDAVGPTSSSGQRKRRKLGVFFSHPTQHHSALFQRLSACSELDVRVYYYDGGSLGGMVDPGYGNATPWDVDLISGTTSRILSNPLRGSEPSAWRQFNPEVVAILWRERFDAIFLAGYTSPSNNIVLRMGRALGAKVLYQSDSNVLDEVRKPQGVLKRLVRRRFFRGVDTFLVVGDCNKQSYERYGVQPNRMAWCPIPVDLSRYEAARHDPALAERLSALRQSLQIPAGSKVVAYCGKLIARKRPRDVIDAVARLRDPNIHTLLIGSGPLERELKTTAPSSTVRITGFVNQSEIPYYMLLADVAVVSSEWDAHPLVTTEFAACGKPIVVSHYCGVVGEHDILREGRNGYVYPCGDMAALAARLGQLLSSDSLRAQMGGESLVLAATQSVQYATDVIVSIVNGVNVQPVVS